MSPNDNSNALTWVLGGALVLIGLFVAILLVSVNSQADSVSTQTTVTNVAPTNNLVLKDNGATVAADGTVTLNAGTTETVTLSGTISDDNGVGTSFANGDLNVIKSSLAVNGTNCTDPGVHQDNNNCYMEDSAAGTCALGSVVNTTTINYTCTYDVEFYADSTSTGGVSAAGKWTATVYVEDDSSASATSTQDFEIGTLLALQIPGNIDYGTLAREASTTNSNNQEMTITQYGNDGADVEVSSAAAMSCSVVGTIPVANQKWSLTDLSAGASGVTALSGTAADTNLAVNYRTNDAAAQTKILYWNIVMPAVASGTCTGTNTITAVAS